MRRLLLALALFPLAAPAAPVRSGAYRWAEAKIERRGAREERAVLRGTTLDLDSLDLRGVTLAGGAADSGEARPSLERFLMVREGALRVSMNGVSKVLGPGSVAVAMPGDRQVVANAGSTPASYYRLAYRAKAAPDTARGRESGGSFMVDRRDMTERTTASGTRRDAFDRPTAMFRRFEAHFSSVNEGLRNHATHAHRAEEIMIFTRGAVELLIDDARPAASAGDIAYLGTQTRHSLANVGRGPTEYLVIQGE